MDHSSLHITEKKLLDIVAVASAYYEQNATQQQIAQEFTISRSQVSRYLDKARKLGIVTINITLPDSHSSELEIKLKELYPCLRNVLVAPFSSNSATDKDLLLGRMTAKYLMDNLRDGVSLGVGSGRSVQSVVNWLTPTSQKISVVQIMGSTGYFAQGIDYTLLANEAATKLNAPLYILNAPTVLWKGAGTVENLAKSNKLLTKIIDMSKNCNIYLLGVGAIENDDVFVKSGLLEKLEMDSVRKEGAVGNICASFFNQHGELCTTSFEDRIVGVRRDDIKKAEHSILIATGIGKIKAIVGSLRGELVNTLATDYETAQQIVEFEISEKK